MMTTNVEKRPQQAQQAVRLKQPRVTSAAVESSKSMKRGISHKVSVSQKRRQLEGAARSTFTLIKKGALITAE